MNSSVKNDQKDPLFIDLYSLCFRQLILYISNIFLITPFLGDHFLLKFLNYGPYEFSY